MKQIGLLLATAVLTGCAVVHSGGAGRLDDEMGFDPALVTRPKPTLPNVFVINGRLVVDQEPIRISSKDAGRDRKVSIAWALSARSSEHWPQADKAISIRNAKGDKPADWSCSVSKTEKILSCSYTFRPGEYKYTLNVRDGNIELPPLDPYIVNIE